MNLYNGLAVKNNKKYISVNRDFYIELCTPICCNYYLFKFVFLSYIITKYYYEFIDILNKLNINYMMLNGTYKYLKKITVIDDV